MLRIRLHPRPPINGQADRESSSPKGDTVSPSASGVTNCGYRLEAAARRAGVASMFGRENRHA